MNAGAAVLATVLALGAACAPRAQPVASKAASPATVRLTDPEPATGTRWMKPVLADRPGPGYYLYFTVDRERRKGPVHAVFEAWSERWLLADRVLVQVDGKAYELAIPTAEWKRGHVQAAEGAPRPVLCVERVDVPLGTSSPALLAALCAARRVEVRVAGRLGEAAIDERGPVFLDAAREICRAHEQPAPAAKPAAAPAVP